MLVHQRVSHHVFLMGGLKPSFFFYMAATVHEVIPRSTIVPNRPESSSCVGERRVHVHRAVGFCLRRCRRVKRQRLLLGKTPILLGYQNYQKTCRSWSNPTNMIINYTFLSFWGVAVRGVRTLVPTSYDGTQIKLQARNVWWQYGFH